MGYNYPRMQGHFYSIQAVTPKGYNCPMDMTFKEALEHAMKVTGRGRSLRDVAKQAGVSYEILKNIKQGKSEKPNAQSATKIADFFGVSLTEFYAGLVQRDGDEDAAVKARDMAAITEIVRRLQSHEHRELVQTFARALLQSEEARKPTE